MPERFYDIFPPQKRPAFSPVFIEVKEKKPSFGQPPKKKYFLKKRFSKIFLFLLLILVTFGGGIFFPFKFRTLKLMLWPKTEDFSYDYQIYASLNTSKIDVENKTIPAFFIEESKQLEQEFNVNYKELKESRAEGKLTVYNKDSKPLSLRKETRFLSENNKTFIAPEPIFIPGNSSVEVNVVAIESGEEYNIGPSNFSLPGLGGSPRYFTTYAKSTQPMKGGEKKEIKKLTEEEFENAKNQLIEKASNSLKESLKKKAKNYILFEQAINFETKEVFSKTKIGSEVDKFDILVRVKASAIVFKETDLKELLKNILEQELFSDKMIFWETLNFENEFLEVNFSSGLVNLKSKIKLKISSRFDETLIKTQALNKQKEEIERNILENFPEILKAEAKIFPFWVKTSPKDLKRIKIFWRVD